MLQLDECNAGQWSDVVVLMFLCRTVGGGVGGLSAVWKLDWKALHCNMNKQKSGNRLEGFRTAVHTGLVPGNGQ